MKRRSTMLLLGTLVALWMAPVLRSPAQAPTEEELKDYEHQAEELEKKQAEAAAKAEAKRKAEAVKKAAAAAEAKRKAAQKRAEEDRRPAEEAQSARPESASGWYRWPTEEEPKDFERQAE